MSVGIKSARSRVVDVAAIRMAHVLVANAACLPYKLEDTAVVAPFGLLAMTPHLRPDRGPAWIHVVAQQMVGARPVKNRDLEGANQSDPTAVGLSACFS